MALLLNIETSTEICSIAISKGDRVLSLQESAEDYQHAAQITLLIEKALQEANVQLWALDAISLSQGPGSYTALRIGASTAKGIGYALNKPLLAIDTLKALASATSKQAPAASFIAPMIDARRMEVYTALFDHDLNRLTATEAKVINSNSYQSYFDREQGIAFSGNGAPKCADVIDSPHAQFYPVKASAVHLIPLALDAFAKKQFADLAYFSPFYFKSPNITKPKKML